MNTSRPHNSLATIFMTSGRAEMYEQQGAPALFGFAVPLSVIEPFGLAGSPFVRETYSCRGSGSRQRPHRSLRPCDNRRRSAEIWLIVSFNETFLGSSIEKASHMYGTAQAHRAIQNWWLVGGSGNARSVVRRFRTVKGRPP